MLWFCARGVQTEEHAAALLQDPQSKNFISISESIFCHVWCGPLFVFLHIFPIVSRVSTFMASSWSSSWHEKVKTAFKRQASLTLKRESWTQSLKARQCATFRVKKNWKSALFVAKFLLQIFYGAKFLADLGKAILLLCQGLKEHEALVCELGTALVLHSFCTPLKSTSLWYPSSQAFFKSLATSFSCATCATSKFWNHIF